jgi:hypothetical protein
MRRSTARESSANRQRTAREQEYASGPLRSERRAELAGLSHRRVMLLEEKAKGKQMKRRTFLLAAAAALVVPFGGTAVAQSSYAEWAHVIESTDSEFSTVNNVVRDGDHLYLNASYNGNVTFLGQALPYYVGSNAVVVKTGLDGTPIWQATLGGNGTDAFYDIALDSEGNVVATGWSDSTDDVEINGEVVIAGDGSFVTKGIVAKFSGADGSLIWIKDWAAAEFSVANPVRLALDAADNVYLGGYYNSSFQVDDVSFAFHHDFGEDLYMLKLDSTGNAVWGQTLEAVDSGGFINMRGVEATANGVYFAFSYYLPLVVNGTPLPHEGDFYWLAITRVDADTGIVGDYTAFGSATGGQDFSQLASDGDGNLVATGFFDSNAGFAVQTIALAGHGSQDGFVAKFDANLDVAWANDIGGTAADRAFNVFVSPDSGVYVGGGFDSLSALSYGATQVLDSRVPSSLSMYELHVDRDGNFDGALGLYGEGTNLGGKGGGTVLSNARSVALPDGSVYSVGNFNGTVEFTPGDPISTLHNAGFFMKWADALPAVSDCLFADGFDAGGAGCGGSGM